MKQKLTEEFAYLAGLTKHSKIKSAIGVEGRKKTIEAFVKHLIEKKIIPPEKIIIKEDKAYTYHSAYKNFLRKIIDEQVDRFKHHNEYAAAFLAGLYDYSGENEQNFIVLKKWDNKDKMMLENLGFYIEPKKEYGLLIYHMEMFEKFIKNYSYLIQQENKKE
jgi:hypothetical protein